MPIHRCPSAPALLVLVSIGSLAPALAHAQDDLIEEIANPRNSARDDIDTGAEDAPDDRDTQDKRESKKSASQRRAPGDKRKGAEEDKGSTTGKAPTEDDDPDAPGNVKGAPDVDLTPRSYAGLVERWTHLVQTGQGDDDNAVRRAASEFTDGALGLGVTGQVYGAQAFVLAEALAQLANERLARGDTEGALSDVTEAIKLAPSLAGPHLIRAAVHRAGEGGIIASSVDAVSALWAKARHFEGQVHLAALACSVFVLAWVLLLWVLALLFLLSSLRMQAYDLFTLIPKGARPWQMLIVVVLLAMVPLLAGLGPVFVPIVWLTATFIYMSVRMRRTVGLVLILALALPYSADAAARFWTYSQSPLHKVFAARLDAEREDLREGLLARPEATLNATELAAAADGAFRAGDLARAKKLLQAVTRRDPTAHWAQNDVAALAAIAGKDDLAKAELTRLLRDAPDMPEAHYNLSQLAFKNPKSGELAALTAQQGNGTELERFRQITFRASNAKRAYNRVFVRVAPPLVYVPAAYAAPSEGADAMSMRFASALFMGLGKDIATALILGLVFLCFLLELVGRRFKPSRPCVRCGAASSKRFDRAEVPDGTCSSCYHAFHRTGDVDARTRLAKERQVRRYARSRTMRVRALGVLLPGTGHLLMNAPVRGVLLLSVAVLLGTGVLFSLMPLAAVALFETGILLPIAAPLALVFVIAYLFSVRRLFLWSEGAQ